MDLSMWGFDGWFAEHAAAILQPGQCLARVLAVDRGAFVLRCDEGEIHAALAGRFRFALHAADDLPCVGDWVAVQGPVAGGSGPSLIHAVLPRKTVFRRKAPGKNVEYQLIAANIDRAFIVQGCGFDFNPARLERYLVMANEGGIEPWLILTKTDLVAPDELAQTLERLGRTRLVGRILPVSNVTGLGLDELRALLIPGKTHCLLGSSGVGKSTLINRLLGHDALATRGVSATGEGVHTTVRRQLLLLPGGAMLIDTPGMRELGLLATADGLDDTFSEINELAAQCRFGDCTHTAEPGCAVRAALQSGALTDDRYRSFLKLRKETEYNERSYVENRQRDKSLGRFYKSVKKGKR